MTATSTSSARSARGTMRSGRASHRRVAYTWRRQRRRLPDGVQLVRRPHAGQRRRLQPGLPVRRRHLATLDLPLLPARERPPLPATQGGTLDEIGKSCSSTRFRATSPMTGTRPVPVERRRWCRRTATASPTATCGTTATASSSEAAPLLHRGSSAACRRRQRRFFITRESLVPVDMTEAATTSMTLASAAASRTSSSSPRAPATATSAIPARRHRRSSTRRHHARRAWERERAKGGDLRRPADLRQGAAAARPDGRPHPERSGERGGARVCEGARPDGWAAPPSRHGIARRVARGHRASAHPPLAGGTQPAPRHRAAEGGPEGDLLGGRSNSQSRDDATERSGTMTRRRITSVACAAALSILGVAAAPASAEIGLKPGTDFDAELLDQSGDPQTQAGSHPDRFITHFKFATLDVKTVQPECPGREDQGRHRRAAAGSRRQRQWRAGVLERAVRIILLRAAIHARATRSSGWRS